MTPSATQREAVAGPADPGGGAVDVLGMAFSCL